MNPLIADQVRYTNYSSKCFRDTLIPNYIIDELKVVNLIAYLRANNVWFSVLEKQSTVHTADAAAATGLPLEKVTKSLVFLAESEPVVAIIPGTCRVDKGKLKERLGVKTVRIVPFAEAKRYTGYPPGATPPVHYKKVKRVIIDEKVMQHETVFGGGGSRKKLIELKSSDIQRLNNAMIADIVGK